MFNPINQGNARGKAALYFEEEQAIRKVVHYNGGGITLKDLRGRLCGYEVFSLGQGDALRKRISRAIDRLEDLGAVERMYSNGQRATGLRLTSDYRSLENFVDGLKARGGGRAALAVTLALAERSLRNQLPARYIDELEGLFSSARDEVERISSEVEGPERVAWDAKALIESIYITQKGLQEKLRVPAEPDTLDKLYEAIATGKTIAFEYKGKRRPGKKDVLCGPLGVVFRGPKSYLIGENLADKNDLKVRAWSINRIRGVEILISRNYIRPSSFLLSRYVQDDLQLETAVDPSKDFEMDIEVKVFPHPLGKYSGATVVDEFMDIEVSGMKGYRENKDGSINIYFRRRDTVEFRRWINGYGDAVVLIEENLS